jgi:hypothetical protein
LLIRFIPDPMSITDTQIRWFRLRRSGLVDPFASPEAAATALVGIQAQILPAAGLALSNRTTGLTFDQCDRLLHRIRSLVKLWGQRGTLHLYSSRDWPLICGALSGQRTWWERQGEQVTGSNDAYQATLARVEKLLRQRGTLSRSDLRASGLNLDKAFFSSWGGIFAALVQRGYACHAEQEGNEGCFAHREFWLPDLVWDPPSYDEANIEITRRYLRAYGPAAPQDLIYWRCAKAGDARRWLDALKNETVEVNVEDRTILALRDDLDTLHEKPPARGAWPVKLLYRFDPLLLGIKDKKWIVEDQHYKRVFRQAGHIEGTLLEYGRIAGTWRYDRKDSGLAITLIPFSPLSRRVRLAVEKQAEEIARFFGLPLTDWIVKHET